MEASRDEKTGRWTLSGVEESTITFDRICKMLREGENFKFARYGDGEFNCMSGKIGHNCDGHEYFPDLGMALNNAFHSDPSYMVGIQPLSVQGGLYQRATMDRPGPQNIFDADVLHSASIDGKIEMFIDAMDGRSIVIAGPSHLIPFLQKTPVFYNIKFIPVPAVNCWFAHERIGDEIYEATNPEDIVLLCASMMSEVLIDQFKDSAITMIDCGSVFDIYAGKPTRSYHYKMKNANL